MAAQNYGNYYWCVLVKKNIASSGRIYLHADSVRVADNGTLFFEKCNKYDEVEKDNMIICAGMWFAVYAANIIDGTPIAVEHKEDEKDED